MKFNTREKEREGRIDEGGNGEELGRKRFRKGVGKRERERRWNKERGEERVREKNRR